MPKVRFGFVSALALAAASCLGTGALAATITSEDFETGASGWNVNTTTDGGATFTTFLGRFPGGGGARSQDVFKTFALSGTQTEVTVSFNFYELDSWDSEQFIIFVDGVELFADTFQHGSDQGDALNAIRTRTRLAGNGSENLGFEGWEDQTYLYEFTFATTAASLTLGFGATIGSGIADESFGIDNLLITDNSTQQPGGQVSEPASMALLGAALGGLLWRRRRRAGA